MKLNKELKITEIVFQSIAIIVIVIGLFFSFLIAKLDDAPGIILIGTTFTMVCASFVYGIGEIIISLKKNNELLSNVYKELMKKDK